MAPRWTNVINCIEAARLHRKLKNWNEVGRALAKREGRPIPYQGASVRVAVWRYRTGRQGPTAGWDDF